MARPRRPFEGGPRPCALGGATPGRAIGPKVEGGQLPLLVGPPDDPDGRVPRQGRISRVVSRTPAGSSRRCTGAGSGRSGSTPGSGAPRRRTVGSASSSRAARPGSRSRSTSRRRSATTRTTRAPSGEVGRCGVPIASLGDMRTLFRGIPLDQATVSMTINATAPILDRAPGRGRGGERRSREPGSAGPSRTTS